MLYSHYLRKILKNAGIEPVRVKSQSEVSGASATVDDSDEPKFLEGLSPEKLDFNKHKEMFEKEFIIKALQTFKGRINQTALHANIPKKTLLRKIEKYGINAKDYFDQPQA